MRFEELKLPADVGVEANKRRPRGGSFAGGRQLRVGGSEAGTVFATAAQDPMKAHRGRQVVVKGAFTETQHLQTRGNWSERYLGEIAVPRIRATNVGPEWATSRIGIARVREILVDWFRFLRSCGQAASRRGLPSDEHCRGEFLRLGKRPKCADVLTEIAQHQVRAIRAPGRVLPGPRAPARADRLRRPGQAAAVPSSNHIRLDNRAETHRLRRYFRILACRHEGFVAVANRCRAG